MKDIVLKYYNHDNGRQCLLGSDGTWRHWEEQGTPLYTPDVVCRMDHLIADIQMGSVITDADRAALIGRPVIRNIHDRGDFCHTDGRECRYKDGDWWFDVNPELPHSAVDICDRDHPSNDRGGFGMPGLGSAGAAVVGGWSLPIAPQTELAERIVGTHLPAALEHFLRRNAEYGDDVDFNLGSRGQYVDISRKVQKLKRLMWEGEQAKDGAESARTIVMELIGHLLMTMDYMMEEDGVNKEG
jgi:hypothetical protein